MPSLSLQSDDPQPLVLLVDDCPDVHRILEVRLRNEQIRVVAAASGPEGIEEAHRLGPDLILLDLDMPNMDGFEVLRALKDDPATRDIPVIVLSGLHSPQDKVTAFDLGAVDYVTKPFDMTELRVRVRSALRVASLLQMLAQQAHIDGLSGLGNRGSFDQRWRAELSGASRHGRALSLAILDIDHFKMINDTYGHPAGDAVIQQFARIIQREARTSDIPCRYGGEEFAIIMPDTTPADALTLIERVRARLEETRWPRHPEHSVTASCGIVGTSQVDGAAADPAVWVEAADRNLYRAKEGGRNRTVVGEVDAPGAAALRNAG